MAENVGDAAIVIMLLSRSGDEQHEISANFIQLELDEEMKKLICYSSNALNKQYC